MQNSVGTRAGPVLFNTYPFLLRTSVLHFERRLTIPYTGFVGSLSGISVVGQIEINSTLQILRCIPALEGSVTSKLWSIEDIVSLI
jgi:hypothetical protein